MCQKYPGPRCDTEVLTRLMNQLGFQRGYFGDDNMEARLELLMTRGGLEALAERIKRASTPSSRARLLAAYRTGYSDFISKMESIGKTPRPIKNHPSDWESVEPDHDLISLQRVAHSLYGYESSPLYHKARRLEKKFTSKTSGYSPNPNGAKVLAVSTAKVAEQMKIDPTTLPANTVAYDIETDTSQGYGLQPHRTQITEIVLTDNQQTIVLAGDERQILQQFADHMNSRPQGTHFIGWNNQGFDNPALYIRGQHHADHLTGWGMSIESSSAAGAYMPVGGFEKPQSMIWTTPEGVQHKDEDVMRSIKNSAVSTGNELRLKPLARAWGAEPLELERDRMHEYSAQEREAYVASDGVATLFNYAMYLKKSQDQ